MSGIVSVIRYNSAACLLPAATTCLAGLLSLLPVQLPGYSPVAPIFALMAVYHWTIYRPDLLPPLALFGIGIVDDLLTGDHVGVTPLVFLISRAIMLRSRRWFFDRTFPFIWGGFVILTASTMTGLWATEAVLAFHFARPGNVVTGAALMISIFPLVSSLLGRAQRALLS